MERGGYVYILTNKNNKVLYTGVTSNLRNRLYEHRTNKYKNSFSAKYKTHKLLYYRGFHTIEEAIAEEKRIKGGSRKKKIILIEKNNKEWKDLSYEVEELLE